MRCRGPGSTQATHVSLHGYRECLARPSMVGEAAIIGQQLRLTALADVPIEGVLAFAVRGVAAAVDAAAAALLDRQGVAGAVDRRAAQVLGEPGERRGL